MSEDVRRQIDGRCSILSCFCGLGWIGVAKMGVFCPFVTPRFSQHLKVLHWIKYSIGFTSEQVCEVTTARCKIQLFYLD